MPHDVTMPQLGMTQDAGRLVVWLKAPGDPVAKGDALFEVETDKATMEVEAQASGFLTGVTASEGEDVPVGNVIARITETADEETPVPEAAASAASGADEADALPEGKAVTMPQLGMAQDSGLLVGWQVKPGDAVAADDVLFEVETDKSTMEVPAGIDGFLAATLAEAGEDVPVGDPVAIISKEKPSSPVARPRAAAPAAAPQPAPVAEAKPEKPAPAKPPKPASTSPAPTAPAGRVLASPKARRLALEQGLDLQRLVEAGHPQPYHVSDLEVLRALPAKGPQAAAAGGSRRVTASIARDGFAGFARWAAEAAGLGDANALLAGLAAASLGRDGVTVAVESPGTTRAYTVPAGPLGAITPADPDTPPDLRLRDLRLSRVTGVALGAEDAPVLSLTTDGDGLSITLECAADQLGATDAVSLLSNFAGRMEQPLRHLL